MVVGRRLAAVARVCVQKGYAGQVSCVLASCITNTRTYLDDETGSIRLSPDENDGALGAPPQAFDLLKFLLQKWRGFGVGEKKRKARDLKYNVFSCACVMQGRESREIHTRTDTHRHRHTHKQTMRSSRTHHGDTRQDLHDGALTYVCATMLGGDCSDTIRESTENKNL